MDLPKFTIEVVTPEGVVFRREAVSLRVPGAEGSFGVLANHAPFITAMTVGLIEVNDGQGLSYLATSGGFAEVLPHKTTIIAETAELSVKIDVERAEASAKRARERLAAKALGTEIERAQLSLMRALNRIKVAGMK